MTHRLTPATAYAMANGWRISPTRGGHKAYRKGAATVFGPSTPGDRRSVKNVVAKMKRVDRGREVNERD